MSINQKFDKYVPAIVFAIVYLCLLPFFRHKIVWDMVSYLTISEQLASGNFFDSVNAYWSPLISWLVSPFLLMGTEGVLAYKILNLFAGMIVLVQLYHLTYGYVHVRWQQLLLPFVCIHQLLYFSLCNATPDIIALACWFTFFNQLRKLIDNPTHTTAVVTGLLGTLCYVAKYYHFYAVIFFLIAASIWMLYTGKQTVFKQLMLASGAFMVLSIIWIGILYLKVGVWAPTTASAFNMNLIRPGGFMHPMQVGNRILPIDYGQFKITSWENPLVYPIPAWSPFQNWDSLYYHLTVHVRDNILHFRNKHVVEFCLFGIACLYALINRRKYATAEWVLLASILLYPIGYFWLIALSRYVLFSMFLALIWIWVTANKLTNKKLVVWVIIGLGMMYSHYISYKRIKDYPDKGANYAQYYEAVVKQHPFSKHTILSSPSCWAPALYFSYYTQSKLFDVLKPELLQTQQSQIKALHIEYYFCKRKEVPEALTDHIIFEGEWVLVALP